MVDMRNPVHIIAQELALPERGILAVIELLNDGSTVPFIARYRKEATGNLDEVQIRAIQERRAYIIELEERRATIIESIVSQGKMTDELSQKIAACMTKAGLEDLYLPYKPKRRTRAMIAREKGLEPLALRILEQPLQANPHSDAAAYVSSEKEIASAVEALAGARDIIAEMAAENAEIRAHSREVFAKEGMLHSEAVADKSKEPTKFEQYYDFAEGIANIPSHRFLALRRGEREGVLKIAVTLDAERVLPFMRQTMALNPASAYAPELEQALADSYHRLLAPSVETDLRVDLKMRSDRDAVEIFASNLRNLLLASPLGGKAVIGIDPGLRTGCKCVAISDTGKFLDNTTLYLTQGEGALTRARHELLALIARYEPACIAIGNGTAGRETEAFVRTLLQEAKLQNIIVIAVSESGASVYSASDIAREEFPDLDLTVRGAISIGRRLQDPLAELVKIDPKAIGVGQYQHDVHQPLLQRKLDEVVESCVNHVGVEINTASAPLLARVAGIGPTMAKKIVAYREDHGAFKRRKDLLDISGFGPRTFEQAAGFLRLHNAENPLDASAVHPERYDLVETIAKDLGVDLKSLVGNSDLVKRIDINKYIGDGVGALTLKDIVDELQKPGRDPRQSFEPPKFRDDVFEMSHLKTGMEFEGVVTNVTAFGAFVDIGVHQDGLVHISQLSDKFIKDPSDVVKVGDKLKVRVLEVDVPRKRISLTAKTLGAKVAISSANSDKAVHTPSSKNKTPPQKFSNNPFAKLRGA